MSMAMDDWALFWSLSPAGDQWQYSADQFLEPYDLLGSKSDEAEHQLFHDGVIVPNSVNTVLSDYGSCMSSTVYVIVAPHVQNALHC